MLFRSIGPNGGGATKVAAGDVCYCNLPAAAATRAYRSCYKDRSIMLPPRLRLRPDDGAARGVQGRVEPSESYVWLEGAFFFSSNRAFSLTGSELNDHTGVHRMAVHPGDWRGIPRGTPSTPLKNILLHSTSGSEPFFFVIALILRGVHATKVKFAPPRPLGLS